jgi:hypothetical protein
VLEVVSILTLLNGPTQLVIAVDVVVVVASTGLPVVGLVDGALEKEGAGLEDGAHPSTSKFMSYWYKRTSQSK